MSAPKIKNMEDFAAVVGISRPTISKYFNDPQSVRNSTRAKIEAALARHDYRPNVYAVNQNRRQTKNIGLVVPNMTDPFFAGIARMIEGMIIAAGYNPLLFSSHGGPAQEIANLDNLRDLKPAGVLLAPLGRASLVDQVAAFADEIPTVLFDTNLGQIGAAFFGSDNQQSVDLIVQYLCRSGEPPSFFEMKTPINPNAHRRRNAYLAAMERCGHDPHVTQIAGEGWDFEDIGFREGMRILAQRSLPTNTVLCSNDRLAIGLLSAAYESGLRVGLGPGSALRVAGHDDHPFARFTCPGLTTIAQDYDSIATRSVETILALIENGTPPQTREVTLFQGRLVMRGSA